MTRRRSFIQDEELGQEVAELEERIGSEWKKGLAPEIRGRIWSESFVDRWQASSGHLADPEAFVRWRAAGEWMQTTQPQLTKETLQILNQKVLGLPVLSPFRNCPTQNRMIHFAPPEAIEPSLLEVLKICERETAGIETAAHLIQELLTIHPFDDGNGRSLRLALDLYLFQNEMPPPTYDSQMDLLLANSFEGSKKYSFDHAVILVGTALEKTLDGLTLGQTFNTSPK